MEHFYGYGIVNVDGYAVTTLSDIDPAKGEKRLQDTVVRWNTVDSYGESMAGCPFRVVSLFYKDGQS